MQNKSKKLLWGLALLVVLVGGFWVYQQSDKKQIEQNTKPTIGYVDMEKAIMTHPLNMEYKALVEEYETLQATYRAEQRLLSTKALAEQQSLEDITKNPSLYAALNAEYRAKITVKENEMNSRLAREYEELFRDYLTTHQLEGSEANIEIVNLQLELQGLTLPSEERIEKEKRLAELLATTTLNENTMSLAKQEIDKQMAHKKEEAMLALKKYEEQLVKEMLAKRDQKLHAEATDIIHANNLPDAVLWNEDWRKRLADKQLEVQSMERAIEEDIEVRVKALAESKGLSLVLSRVEAKQNILDMTDAVIASYQ